jgi:hypothetical protein
MVVPCVLFVKLDRGSFSVYVTFPEAVLFVAGICRTDARKGVKYTPHRGAGSILLV